MAKNGRPTEERNIYEADKRVRKDIRIGKSKEKFEETDLPSPPPDPWTSRNFTQVQSSSTEPAREEDDIIAYLAGIRTPPCDSANSDCLSRNSATSTMAVTSLYTEESFEQLDRLYDMAEQILELRDRSSKLFRRVRELERSKVLRIADLRAERAIVFNEDISSDLPDEDAGFAESLLDAIISSSRDSQVQRRNPRSPYSRQRSRSLAVSEQSLPRSPNLGNRSSLGLEKTSFRNETSGAPKVSKWTRVKAAFKWERACPNDVTDSSVEQTPTTPTTPTTKYLRIPDISSGSWSGSVLSPSSGELSAPSTPIGRPSSASSSNEDVFDRQRKNVSDLGDKRIPRPKEGPKKDEPILRSPSPENVTTNDDAMQYKSEVCEVNHSSKPLIRITTESTPEPQIEGCDSNFLMNVDKGMETTLKKPTPMLTITIPLNEEEFRNASSPESTSPLPSSALDSGQSSPHRAKIRYSGQILAEFKRQRSIAEESPAPKIQRMDSKWNKVRRAFLSNAAFSVPPSPVRVIGRQSFLQDDSEVPRAHSCSGSVDDLTKNSLMSNNQSETRRDYQALREKLGAEFHQKLIEWERLKRSTGGNTKNIRDIFSSSNGTTLSSPHESVRLTEDRLDPEFKKKLQEWKRSKKGRRGSASIEPQRVNRRRLTDWQLWRSPSKPEPKSQELMEPRYSCGSVGSTGSVGSDGKVYMCEDFARRMETWRRLSEAFRRPSSARIGVNSDSVDETEFMSLDRVLTIFGNLGQEIQNGDWFEENSKLAEKSQSFKSGNEILIRTSVGSYRFEGISQEFTRKLYDWEKYRGISPRSSTFRLLGPAYAPFLRTVDDSTTTVVPAADDKEVFLGGIKRSKSVGSFAEAAERTEPFIRRSASLRSLNYLTEKLEETDLMTDSPAPDVTIDLERRPNTSEDTNMDDSEPEAMIVDIEDVIEETASPLRRVQPHQTPVYSVAASETTSIAVPLGTVTSSHEPSPVILMENKDDSDREHWESRNWNSRSDLPNQDSCTSGSWSSPWSGMEDYPRRDNTVLEFNEYWRGGSDQDDQNISDQETWKFVGWDRTSKYSSKDDESVKSAASVESIQNDRLSASNLEDCTLRSEVPDLRFSRNDDNNINENWTLNYECVEDKAMHRVSKSEGFPIKIMEASEETTELPCENIEEQSSERERMRKDTKDDNSINDKSVSKYKIQMETERIPSFIYHRRPVENILPVDNIEILPKNSTLSLESDSDSIRENELITNMTDEGNKNEDEYNQNRRIYNPHKYTDFPTIKSTHQFIASGTTNNEHNKDSNKQTENTEISKENEKKTKAKIEFHEPTAEATSQKDSNIEFHEPTIKTTLSKNATIEFDEQTFRTPPKNSTKEFSEATIRSQKATTKEFNESTIRTTRYIQRIIINEQTLKKIVVPTASSDNSNDSFSKNAEPSNILHDNCTLQAALKQSDEPAVERDSSVVNQNVNNSERGKQRMETDSSNVFVKTKRMIFSPFRRLDNNRASGETNSDRIERRKSKSKSRSTSPRNTKYDVLPKMPWTLRSFSKESETKEGDFCVDGRAEERSWFKKYHRSREERGGIQRNERIVEKEEEKDSLEFVSDLCGGDEINKKILNVEEKGGLGSNDKESRKVYRDPVDDGYEEIIVRENEEDRRLPVASIGIEEEEKMNRSSTSDTLSSDLIHKLRILSNAAAKRDGRISSCIDVTTIDSRSSRIQRAKEGFLSRRGGPLCRSMLDPSNPVIPGQDGDAPFTEEREALTSKAEYSISEDNNQDALNNFSYPTPPTSVPQSPNLSKNSNSKSDLIKSASAGMINVDPDTFDRLATTNRGCESLPRTISKRRDSGGPLTRIVNKLRLSRLMRSKDNGDRNMSTISTLCRQSLLIDVRPDLEENHENENRSEEDEEDEKKENR